MHASAPRTRVQCINMCIMSTPMQAAPAGGAAAQRETWSTGRAVRWKKCPPNIFSREYFLNFMQLQYPLLRPSHASAPTFNDVFLRVPAYNMRSRTAGTRTANSAPLRPCPPGSPSKLVWEAAVGPSVLENCTMESHVVTAVGMRYCCGGACTVGLKSLEPLLIIHIPREGGLGEHV